MALALSALVGVASAAAGTAEFAAESYPATLKGEGTQKLSANGSAVDCNTNLGAEAAAQTAVLGAALSGTCSSFGSNYAINMNGCRLELHPDWNAYDIGPKGCGPITATVGLCSISILPQAGLKATYQSVTEGAKKAILVTSEATHLKYKTGPYFCGGAGTFEDGGFVGSWVLSGSNSKGGANGIHMELASHGPAFEAESYPVSFVGAQEAENQHAEAENHHVFNTEAGPVECEQVTFAGSASAGSTALTLAPSYAGCKGFGFLSGTIAMNGCSYVYHATGNNSEDINCPAGHAIEIVSSTCQMKIEAQSGLGSVTYENAEASGHEAISLVSNVSGLTYTVTKDGFLCKFAGTGVRSGGSYTGRTLLQGFDSEGFLENIREGD